MDFLDRSIPPQSHVIPKVNIQKPKVFQFTNGLKILVVENHKLPIVSVSLYFDRSPIAYQNKAGLQYIFGNMFRSGTKNYTKEQFDEMIEQVGTTFYSSSSKFFLSTLKKHLNLSLKLMSEAILNVTFNNVQEFTKLIKQGIINFEIAEQDANLISDRVRKVLLFGNKHPYGEYASHNSLKNIQLEDLQIFYKNNIYPDHAYLIFVGDITEEEAHILAKKNFSSWSNQNHNTQNINYNIPLSKNQTELFLVDLPHVTQSNISILKTIKVKKKHPDYLPFFLTNEILGGGIQSRLCQNLREKNGYTYGAYSVFIPDKNIGSFFACAQVRNAVTLNAIKEFLKELQNICNDYVSHEELSLKKKELSGHFLLKLENFNNIADFALDEFIEGLPENFYQNYINNIQNITADQILEIANKYLSNQYKILIIGNLKEILKNIEELNYPIHILDKYGNFTTSKYCN